MQPLSASFDALRSRLTELGAQPVVIGAFAAGRFRATPRETVDIDFLVTSLDGVAPALRADGLDVREVADERGEPYLVHVRGTSIVADALLVETDYQAEAHRRADDGFLTIEDVLVHKLIAWRARDRDDIASILSARHAFDVAYVERWAAAWSALDRWRTFVPEPS
jgi:hypothetical protein